MVKNKFSEAPDVRQKILDAAADAFAELGFAGARVDDIARRAKVNKALVYYYVGDKQVLFEAVFEQIVERGVETFERAVRTATTSEERIEKAVQNLALMVRTQPYFAPLVLRAVASGGEGVSPRVIQAISRMYSLMLEGLEHGQASGHLRKTDPIITTMMLAGAVLFLNSATPLREGIRSLIRPEDLGSETPESLASEVAGILLRGIVATPRSSSPEESASRSQK